MKNIGRTIVCVLVLVTGLAAQTPDEVVSDLIAPLIDNPGTGEVKPIRVADLEELLRQRVTLHANGYSDVFDSYVSFSYALTMRGDSHAGPYGLDILARRGAGDSKTFIVTNVRLSYTAPSGTVYYNAFNANVWPIERKSPLVLKGQSVQGVKK